MLARLPLADELVAAYYAAFDRATPLKAKGILIGALAYFILPIDAVPDFVLGLGFTDDMAVLLAAFNVVRSHVTEDHRKRARETHCAHQGWRTHFRVTISTAPAQTAMPRICTGVSVSPNSA